MTERELIFVFEGGPFDGKQEAGSRRQDGTVRRYVGKNYVSPPPELKPTTTALYRFKRREITDEAEYILYEFERFLSSSEVDDFFFSELAREPIDDEPQAEL